MRSWLFFTMLLLVFPVWGQLPLRLPSVLSDHAVIQQNAVVKLWGWGPGGDTVKIIGSWAPNDTIKVAIGADCDWETTIKTASSGGPYAIVFKCGKQEVKITDILFGEVWLCSGQSNMEFNAKWGITDGVNASETCANNAIRFFQVEQDYNRYPQVNCKGRWVVCNDQSMAAFSSVGYYFGRQLNDKLRVPVGLIGAYWGGTCIQAWMPREVFDANPDLQPFTRQIEAYGWAPKGASLLFNSMIFPVTNYRIAGTIWYQGEANVASESNTYFQLFSAMVQGWRRAFQQNNLPFYYVQIAPCNYYEGIKSAYLREQQELALGIEGTGMVSVADLIDDVTNLHPGRKRAVGERLANIALKERYGDSGLQPYSPKFSQFEVKGKQVIVAVSSVGKLCNKGTEIRNFQLAGADKIFYPAAATLGKDGRIYVSSAHVDHPVNVRYCFTNDAVPTLFDMNGLPLLPFRTDKW